MIDQVATRMPAIVALPAEIDLNNADLVYGQITAAVAADAGVVIADFTATTFCDSAGVRSVVLAQKHAAARHVYLRLAVPPGGGVRRTLELMGLDRVLPVYSGLGEAAAAARG